jgi:hypothetical protein
MLDLKQIGKVGSILQLDRKTQVTIGVVDDLDPVGDPNLHLLGPDDRDHVVMEMFRAGIGHDSTGLVESGLAGSQVLGNLVINQQTIVPQVARIFKVKALMGRIINVADLVGY